MFSIAKLAGPPGDDDAHRRFSLASTITASAAREAELGRVRDDSSRGGCGDSKSVPVSPEKR